MKKIIIILLFISIFFLVFLGRFVFLKKTTTKFSQLPITPTLSPRGQLTIELDRRQYSSLSDPVDISILASSNGYLIIGYDVDLRYDKNKLKFLSANNLRGDEFDLFNKEVDTGIIITGIKKLTVDKKIIFNRERLLTINFQPLDKGKVNINLAWQKDSNRQSNLITEGSLDILDQVTGASVSIGQEISLTKGQIFSINRQIKLILVDFVPLEVDCIDCLSTALVQVDKDGGKKQFEFKIGGFAGYMVDQLTAYDLTFALKKIDQDRVDLIIYEE